MKRKDGAPGLVYYACCTVNGKGYVGQHTGTDGLHRWRGHLKAARDGVKLLLPKAIRKHGADSFIVKVVWRGNAALLNEKETYYIRKFGTFVDDPRGGGYNLTEGGGNYNPSARSRRRLSKSIRKTLSERPWIAEHRSEQVRARFSDPRERELLSQKLKAVWASGDRKPNSKATKKKAAAAVRTALQRPEVREKLSRSIRASWTEERRKLHSEKVKAAYARDPSLKSRIAAKNSGRTRTPEQRAKMSGNKKHWADPAWREEMVRKLSEASQRRWADKAAHDSHSKSLKSAWRDAGTRATFMNAQRLRRDREREEKGASKRVKKT